MLKNPQKLTLAQFELMLKDLCRAGDGFALPFFMTPVTTCECRVKCSSLLIFIVIFQKFHFYFHIHCDSVNNWTKGLPTLGLPQDVLWMAAFGG